MRTQIEALIENINTDIISTKQLAGLSVTVDQIALPVKAAGAGLERFLKSFVFGAGHSRKGLKFLIDKLDKIGVSTLSISVLHSFRETYNKVKHDETYHITIAEAVDALLKTVTVLQEIKALNFGRTGEPYRPVRQRQLWIAGWDHYTSGETEVYIMLPFTDEYNFPKVIDHFNIDAYKWPVVLNRFAGCLDMRKEAVPAEVLALLNKDDFIGAGLFTGDIKELVKELSLHIMPEVEAQLLPGLKRQDEILAVQSALVFSIQDAFKDDLWEDGADLINEIYLRSSHDYGINIRAPHLKLLVERLHFHNIQLHRDTVKRVRKIVWSNAAMYENTNKLIEIFPGFLAIDSDYHLRCAIV